MFGGTLSQASNDYPFSAIAAVAVKPSITTHDAAERSKALFICTNFGNALDFSVLS